MLDTDDHEEDQENSDYCQGLHVDEFHVVLVIASSDQRQW
ncbi:hypothetical protein PC116_g1517 [Phytophthora cactorum]|nr:hypothetical protein PC114_g440 [Phytophthora cactorum]KAG3035834.1 hypothetical protein PC120_g626 [Phytophthora cactorum]KAG3189611.1 hypothetical protein C6341_g2134 [Phytophthora cactorum]KAG3192775.1 hypothetical protein PC128_g10406 [Phytophthora cactorum]KAG4064855.1 hypothetical protein PC123_g395 [Phytophthora cactorum]